MSYTVDLQKIADELDFDLEDIEMLMEVFLESTQDSMNELKTAIDNNDADTIFRAAHSIKGSAANLTLMEISDLAKEIEHSAREQKDMDYQASYEKLKLLIDAIVA